MCYDGGDIFITTRIMGVASIGHFSHNDKHSLCGQLYYKLLLLWSCDEKVEASSRNLDEYDMSSDSLMSGHQTFSLSFANVFRAPNLFWSIIICAYHLGLHTRIIIINLDLMSGTIMKLTSNKVFEFVYRWFRVY